jgi:hypothetical protein
MKRSLQLLSLIIVSSFLWMFTIAQDYGWEMEMKNFKQTSESEFRFDVYLRKSPTSPAFGLENFQFQILLNPLVKNGGDWANSFLLVDGSETDLVGDMANLQNLFFTTNANQTVIQFASDDVGPPGSVVTVFDDNSWKKVATFIIQISNGGALHNFGDADPELRFRPDPSFLFTVLNRCNFEGSPPNYVKVDNFSTQVDNRTLYPEYGVPLETRQLAGYWFSGDGDWNENARWNNTVASTHPAYHQQPGANSNAIINGNAVIPDGLDVSILPDLNGNGGELTVLTGEEPLYSILLIPNGNNVNAKLFDNTFQEISNPSSLLAGTELYLGSYSTGFGSGTFVNWTDQYNNVLATTNEFGPYYLPEDNMTITANWTSGSKSVVEETNSKNPLFASLTIATGGTLTVDKLFNDSENGVAALVLQSSASESFAGSLIHNNAGVKATVERYLESQAWHYVSPPISNAKSNIFFDIFLRSYLEPTAEWFEIIPTNVNLTKMEGFAAWASNALTGSTTVEYKGFLNVGTQSINLTRTVDEGWGWNLVGNPYSSAIDWDVSGGWTKTNINNSIYLWNPSIGNYGSYADNVGINDATNIIPSGQGFFVKVDTNSTTGSLGVNMSAQLHGNQPFWKKTETVTSTPLLRLQVSTEGTPKRDEIVFRFMDSATEGFDPAFDAYKLTGTGLAPQFYSMIQGGVRLSINSLPKLNENMIIPLGFEARFDGFYTITANELLNFQSNTKLILEDKHENVFIDLSLQDTYNFYGQINDAPGRFNLHFLLSPENVPDILVALEVRIFSFGQKINIQSLIGDALVGEVKVFDPMGRELHTSQVHLSNRIEITVAYKGMAIVSFIDQHNQKLYIEKVYLH